MNSQDKKVDVENLSEHELQKLQEVISKKLSIILNKADRDANKVLSKYGLKAQVVFEMSKEE
jgi:hypothetical protein